MTKKNNKNKDFFNRVYDIVKQIPYGKVTTYGIIAEYLGMKSSSRMVGWALNAIAGRTDIPCHRVVNRKGELSGKMHFATPTLMRELLESEGIVFKEGIIDLKKYLWKP